MRASSPDSDIDDYLSNLRKKTAGKSDDFHIEGLSDLSLSELSEKAVSPKVKSKFIKVDKTKLHTNKKSVASVEAKKSNSKKKKDKKNKLKKNGKENIPKTTPSKKDVPDFSDNDNFSFNSSTVQLKSKTSESFIPKLDLGDLCVATTKMSSKIAALSEDDTSSFGKDGKRYFKMKKTVDDQIDGKQEPDSISTARKSTLRSARSPSSKKKVTILDEKQVDPVFSDSVPAVELSDDNEFSQIDSVDDSNNFCGLNILSFQDIMDTYQDKSGSSQESPKRENIMSIEELENKDDVIAVSIKEDSNYEERSLSEIYTLQSTTKKSVNVSRDPSVSEVKALQPSIRRSSNVAKDQSLSEIMTVLQTDRSSRQSKQYTTDFEESESVTKPLVPKARKPSQSESRTSLDFTEDQTISQINERVEKKKTAKQSKRSKLNYHWDSGLDGKPFVSQRCGMDKIDPTPIAHYIVSPEALESVTAYSPCMILITNMLRQQIQMTQSFMESQRRLYESVISTLRPNYEYCTFDETKEFIRANKARPIQTNEVSK